MDHVSTIKLLIRTLLHSKEMHALLVEGPAGWGKSTAVEQALREIHIDCVPLGSYSTPLHLFNFLSQNQDCVVLIDDSAGVYSDSASMAILKAATWGRGDARKIRWGSTSAKAAVEEFLFRGKLVVVCNSFPRTPDAEAVRSRSFPHSIAVSESEAKALLTEAAQNRDWFVNTAVAEAVARYLVKRITRDSLAHISYRTLRMGYELAEHNPASWQTLLDRMIPLAQEDPKVLVKRLARQSLRVKDQLRAFEKTTGLRRRTFFKYRRELKLSR